MIHKNIIFLLSLLIFSPLAQAQKTLDENFIWEISQNENRKGYIIGILPIGEENLTLYKDTTYDKLFDETNVFAFEVDLDSLRTLNQAAFLDEGYYEDLVGNHLSKNTFNQLSKRLKELNRPLGHHPRMKPWLLIKTLHTMEVKAAGYSTTGLHDFLFQKAKKTGKDFIRFESAKLTSESFLGLSEDKQINILEERLKHSSTNVTNIDSIMVHYKNGELKKLEPLLKNDLTNILHQSPIIQSDSKNPIDWLHQTKELLEQESFPVIILNLNHLIGEDGLINLLRKENFDLNLLN